MKVTDASTYRLMQTNLDRVTNNLQDLRYMGATGIKLNKSSDDTSAIRPVLTTRTQIRHTERYLETMGVSLDKMESTDGHLNHVEGLLQRVKEIGVNAINGALSDSDLDALADEVNQLRDELLDAANSMIDGKYIFAGYEENTKPFIPTPNGYDPDIWDANNPNTWPYVYVGDNNPTNLEIPPGEPLDVNITGNDLFFGISNATINGGNPTQPPLTGMQQGAVMSPAVGSFTVASALGTNTVNTVDLGTGNYAQQIATAITVPDAGLSVTVNASSTAQSGAFIPTTGPYSLVVNTIPIVSAPAPSAYQLDFQIDSFIQNQVSADPTTAGGSIADGDAWFTDGSGNIIEIRGSAQQDTLSFRAANGADITITETVTPGEGFTGAAYNNATDTTYGAVDIGTNSANQVTLAGATLASAGLTAAVLDEADQYAPDTGRLDMFSALTRLEESLRAANIDDPDAVGGGVSQSLEDLELAGNQERRIRSRLGNRARRVETATLHQTDVKIDLEQVLSRYQDADAIEIFNEIIKQETAYKAALSITSKVSQISILNYF